MTPANHRFPRRYLMLFLVACVVSLTLTPPPFSDEAEGVAPAKRSQAQLTAKLAPYLDKGTFGFAAKDLQTGEEYRLADDRVFDGGSTMKLAILAYLYNQASNDQFNLDDQVTITASDVQNYGTGSIRYERLPKRYSYRELVNLITIKSDNTAAHMIGAKLDETKVQAYIESLSLTQTSMANRTTSPRDMLLLMEKLYRGELADPGLTRELLDQMKNTDFEDRLKPRLPDDAVVLHKSGDAIDGGMHDVGVVEYRGRAYAVAMFTHTVPFPTLPDISRQIFDYMTR